VFALVLFGLNHWVGIIALGGDYTPFSSSGAVSALVWDETQLYTPGPRRFSHDGTTPSEMDVYELRDKVNGYPVLHSIVLGWFARQLGSLETVWIVFHALLPACMWLLAYWLLGTISRTIALRSAVAWGTVLFALSPRNALLLGAECFRQPLEATRMPHPALSLLLVLLVAVLTSAALAAPGRKWYGFAFAAGVAAGLTFYAYYFYWVSCFLGLGCLFVLCLIVARPVAYRLAMTLAVGASAGLPYGYQVLRAQTEGTQMELLKRVGDFHRTPHLVGLIFAALLASLLAYLLRAAWARADGRSIGQQFAVLLVLNALLLGGACGVNLHLLTGFDAQHPHFWNRLIQPVGLLFAGSALAWAVRDHPSRSRAIGSLGAGAAMILIALAAYRQVAVALNTGSDHRLTRSRYEVLIWLRENGAQNCVVGTLDPELISMLPGVAGQWVFVPNGVRTVASNDEILQRMAVAARLEGLSCMEFRGRLEETPSGSADWLVPIYLHFVQENQASPNLLAAAERYYHAVELSRVDESRRLDYYVLPLTRSKNRLHEAFPDARQVYQNAEWVVFCLRSQE
jgi:hypothetical protein